MALQRTITLTILLAAWCLLVGVSSFSANIPPTTSCAAVRREPLGRVTSLDRSKLDRSTDTLFYQQPKFVTHTDAAFIEELKRLYSDHLLPASSSSNNQQLVLLDIMASHVSHLPDDVMVHLARLDIHGMNAEELEQNSARKATSGSTYLRDLNANPSFVGLCDDQESYDGILCCVGVQYLEEAEAVFADAARLLKRGTGKIIISFTNRFFYEKALYGWINRGMNERARLVSDYLRAAGGYQDIQIVGDGTSVWKQFASIGGFGGDPFVAVIATRSMDE
jgi:hypothetical protein